jgi:hypothetical protein
MPWMCVLVICGERSRHGKHDDSGQCSSTQLAAAAASLANESCRVTWCSFLVGWLMVCNDAPPLALQLVPLVEEPEEKQ